MVSKTSLLSALVKCLLVSDILLDAEDTAGMRQMLLLLLRFISQPARQVKRKYAHGTPFQMERQGRIRTG